MSVIIWSLISILIVSPFPAFADMFDGNVDINDRVGVALANDQASYHSSVPGYVGSTDLAEPAQDASFRRSWSPNSCWQMDVDTAYMKDLRRALERDRTNAAAIQTFRAYLANNPVLLMEYASPAMADIFKHYRSLAYARMNIDYARCAQLEKSDSNILDTLRRNSERACIYEQRDRGLAEGMARCAAEPGLAHLKNYNGHFVGTDGEIRVLEGALNRMGADSATRNTVVDLMGDTLITEDALIERAPRKKYDAIIREEQEMILTRWIEVLRAWRSGNKDEDFSDLSTPGMNVTRQTLIDLLTLPEIERMIALAKMSHQSAVLSVHQNLYAATRAIEQALSLPGLDTGLRLILQAKYVRLRSELTLADARSKDIESTQTITATLSPDADSARAELATGFK